MEKKKQKNDSEKREDKVEGEKAQVKAPVTPIISEGMDVSNSLKPMCRCFETNCTCFETAIESSQICVQCGQRVDAASNFCNHCGARVEKCANSEAPTK